MKVPRSPPAGSGPSVFGRAQLSRTVWPRMRPRRAVLTSSGLAGLLGGCTSDDASDDASADASQASGSDGAARTAENGGSWSRPSFVAFRQSFSDQTLREGETFALDVRPYFAGRGVVNYTFSNLPEGLVFSPAQMQLTGVVTKDTELGERLVTVTALAETSTVTQSFTLDVQNENEAPESSQSHQTWTQAWSVPFSLDLDSGPSPLFSDPDPGDVLVYDLTGVSFLKVESGPAGSVLVGMASGVGEHVATLVARDNSGLTAVSHLTLTLTENHAPSAIGPPDTTLFVTESVPAALEVSSYFSDPDAGEHLAFTASGLPDGLSVSDDGWVRGEIPEPSSEVYSVTVTAQDGAGLFARYAFELHARRINDPPVRTGEASLHWTLIEEANVSLGLTDLVSDPDAHDSLVFRFSGLPAGLTLETSDEEPGVAWLEGVLASPLPTGTQTHTLTATDRAGASVETTVTFFFQEKITPPHRVAGAPETWTVAEGEVVALTLGDFYTGSGALSFRLGSLLDHFETLDALTAGTVLTGGIVRGRFVDDRASARIQTLEVVISTDHATVTESLFFEVTEVNQPPQILKTIADQTLAENEAVTVDLAGVFTDPDEGHALSLTLTASGVPEGLVFEPRLQNLTGVVTSDVLVEQPLEVQLTATDAAGEMVSVSFTLYVTNANDPVEQTQDFERVQSRGTPGTPGIPGAAGVVLELADYVSDPDPGEVLSYAASVSGAPVVSLDLSGSQLGLRLAPPSPYHFGLAEVTVTIQDKAGTSVSDSFTYRHTHLTLSDELFLDGTFGSVHEGPTLWGIGDIDGDGFSDAGGFTPGSGLALFFGGADGVSKEVSLSSDSSGSDFVFGPAGDVNGDGLADVWLTKGSDEVYVLFGSMALRSSLDLETLSPEAGFVLGVSGAVSVRGGLDVNRDGLSDILVSDANGVSLVYGASRLLGQAVSVTSPDAPPVFRQFLSVERPGPDGSKLGLYTVGSWETDVSPYRPSGNRLPLVTHAGANFYDLDETIAHKLTPGSSSPAPFLTVAESTGVSSAFGFLGDLDGDGNGELAVGLSALTSTLAGGEARVGVYYGGARQAFKTGFEIVSSEPDFGKSLTGVDLNGDGLDELVVASSETVYVIYGRASQRTGTVVLSELSPAVGFALVPQSGSVAGVSGAGDVNGDGFEDLWVRLSPSAGSSEPAASVLVYGNATWGAADRVPVPAAGPATLGTSVSPYGGSGADRFTLSVGELLADPELFRHGGLGSDSLTLTRGGAAAWPSVDLRDMSLTQRLLSFETLVLDGVDLTLSAESVYELTEARGGGLATLELGGQGSVRLSDAVAWTQDLTADPGGDVWSQGRARVRVTSDDLSVSSWTPEPILTLTLGAELPSDQGVSLSLPVAKAGGWVSQTGGSGWPDFLFEAEGQGGVPELRVLRDFTPEPTETLRYRLVEGRVTLQDGTVVVPGELFDPGANLRDRQPAAVESDGTIVPRFTELGRVEPVYQVVYTAEDLPAPQSDHDYRDAIYQTFLGSVLNGDSSASSYSYADLQGYNLFYLSRNFVPLGESKPAGSSWIGNTLTAQDGSKLAVREELYYVDSVVSGQEDAFSLLRFADAGKTLLPGERLMTYDGVTVTDTLVVDQLGDELARLAFHTLIEHGTLTLADGTVLKSGTTLTPAHLADLAPGQTLGTVSDDGRTPVSTKSAQPARLVKKTVVESGAFTYYQDEFSLAEHPDYAGSLTFRQGQPAFDGSFLTFTDEGQILDGDGTFLGTGRPLETLTGLPDWAHHQHTGRLIPFFSGHGDSTLFYFDPEPYLERPEDSTKPQPGVYFSRYRWQGYAKPLKEIDLEKPGLHAALLYYSIHGGGYIKTNVLYSHPDFRLPDYYYDLEARNGLRVVGDTVGTYDTSSGRVVEETLYTETTPPETFTPLTLEVLDTPEGDVSQPFAPVGDVNGDGLADVLLGGEASAAVLYGGEHFGRDVTLRPLLPGGRDLTLDDGTVLRHGERVRHNTDLPGDTTLVSLQRQEEGPYGFLLPVGMAGDPVRVDYAPSRFVEILTKPSEYFEGATKTLDLQLGVKFDADWTLPRGYEIRENGDAEAAIFQHGESDPVGGLQRIYRLVSYGSDEPLLYTAGGRPLYHGDYFWGAPEDLPSGYDILETDDYLIVGRALEDGRVIQSVSLTEAWLVTDLDLDPNQTLALEKKLDLEAGQALEFPLSLKGNNGPSSPRIDALDFYQDGDLLHARGDGTLVRLFAYTEKRGWTTQVTHKGLFYAYGVGQAWGDVTYRTGKLGDSTRVRVVTDGVVELEDGRILLPGSFIRESDTLANGETPVFKDGMLTNQASTAAEVFVPLSRTEAALSVPHISPLAGYQVTYTPPAPAEGEGDETGFGQSVVGLGDVNGDLVDDVAILAIPPASARDVTLFGVAGEQGNDRVLLDLAEAPKGSFFQLDLSEQPAGQSPAVQRAGDVNGDGYGDFLVTAPAADTGTAARVWLFYGSRTLFEDLTAEDAELLVFGPESVALGTQPLLGSAGDFNGDGYDDVFVRITDPSAAESPTRLAVLFGSDDGLADLGGLVAGGATLTPDTLPAGRGFFITHASGEAVSFASDAASVGDVNGDGFSDLVVAASGQSWLLYGTETPAASVEVTQLRAGQGLVVSGLEAPGDGGSVAVRAAGDLNEDGFSDFWLGAPGVGSGAESYAIYGSVEYRSSGQRADFTPPEAIEILDGGGDPGDRILRGDAADDTLVGGSATRVWLGGSGDDVLSLTDSEFVRLDGGLGVDLIGLAGSLTLSSDTLAGRARSVEGFVLAQDSRLELSASSLYRLTESRDNGLSVAEAVGLGELPASSEPWGSVWFHLSGSGTVALAEGLESDSEAGGWSVETHFLPNVHAYSLENLVLLLGDTLHIEAG